MAAPPHPRATRAVMRRAWLQFTDAAFSLGLQGDAPGCLRIADMMESIDLFPRDWIEKRLAEHYRRGAYIARLEAWLAEEQ